MTLELLLTAMLIATVESTVERPIAVRGGVLMVPLEGRPKRWPEEVELRLDDGRKARGHVAWITGAAPGAGRGWSDDPRRLEVLQAPASPEVAAPYLLADLPEDGDGTILLGRQALRPIWLDPPMSPMATGTMDRATRPDRPDSGSPFEHWRWVLLGDRLNLMAPSPAPLGRLEALLARHYADLWRVGLARLAEQDEASAVLCRMALTALAADGEVDFAVWVADARETAALLNVLVDPDVRPQRLVDHAAAWLDGREPLLMWLESDAGPAVRLAAVNRTPRPLVARFQWARSEDIPIAIELPPGELTRAVVDRPPPPEAGPGLRPRAGAETPQVLEIRVDGQRYQLPVAAGATRARPPAAFLPPLRPPLTLAEVESRQRRPIPPGRAAAAHVRRRQGRWELFVECRRPGVADDGGDELTILIGPETPGPGSDVVLVVPERGGHEVRRGVASPDLEVHRRSWADRWYCRVVLPDAWLDRSVHPARLEIGCIRNFGDEPGFQVTPGRSVPWQPVVGRMVVELGEW